MLSPVTGVVLTPQAHPLHRFGATEVILVLRFGQPTVLTVAFAGLPTGGLGAELLVMRIATVGGEIFSAAQAFHEGARKSTPRPHSARSTPGNQSKRIGRRRRTGKKEEEF